MALRFETIQGTRVALGVEWYEVPPGSAADEKTISARLTKSARGTISFGWNDMAKPGWVLPRPKGKATCLAGS